MTYRSRIRWYTAFCQQFGLTPLPLSDLNLSLCLISTPEAVVISLCLSLSCPLLLPPDSCCWPWLQYAVWAFRWLIPSQLGHSGYQSPRPFCGYCTGGGLHPLCQESFVVGCLLSRFFAFLQSGEFTCPLPAAYNSSMLSWGNIQVDSLLT